MSHSSSPPQSAAIDPAVGLRWRSGDALRRLAGAFAIGLGAAMASGALLFAALPHDNLNHVLLLSHLASGMLALAFFAFFVVLHWRDCKEPLLHLVHPFRLYRQRRGDPHAAKRMLGYALMWPVLLVMLSGLLISLPAVAYLAGWPQTLPYGAHDALQKLHLWLTPILPLVLALHFANKEKSR
ncbi:MAG: hypothetical protein PHX38_00745 [Sulfuricella sp.]|nr:hypothetical protein [Sulfuricella sp.]